MNVSAVDYSHVIARLRDKPDALIVLVVDMLDIENSIYRPLVQLLGASAASGDRATTFKRPMIVVGTWAGRRSRADGIYFQATKSIFCRPTQNEAI